MTTPRGLFNSKYRRRPPAPIRRPSTRTSSAAGSALAPGIDTTAPLTVTRPSRISDSAARRDATPAAAISFCSRTPSGAAGGLIVANLRFG